MSHYIEATDITDTVAKAFIDNADTRIEQWLTNVDNEINRLAYSKGLANEEILVPINPIVKEYAVAYFCLMVFKDNIGANNVTTPMDEKYKIKYGLYLEEIDRLKPQCTKGLLSINEGDVDAVSMASVKYFTRG